MLGAMELGRKNTAAALTALRRARSLDKDDPAIATNLAIALHEHGESDAAADLLRDTTKNRPDYAPAHLNLAVVLRASGDLAAAESSAEAAVACAADYHKAWLELGRVRRNLGQADAALAALEHCGALPEALDESGLIEEKRGRFTKAAAHYRRCLDAVPGRIATLLSLAGCLQEAGRIDDALDAYREVIATDPSLYAAVLKRQMTAARGRLWLDDAKLRQALGMARP